MSTESSSLDFLRLGALAGAALISMAAASACSASPPDAGSDGNGTGGGGGAGAAPPGAGGAGAGAGAAGGAVAGTGGALSGAGGVDFGGGLRTSDAGRSGNGMECATSSFESDLLPTNMLILMDRSGSMNCLPTTPTDECEAAPPSSPQPGSKWEAITGAIDSSLTELSKIPDTSVGLTFFSNDGQCGVQSMPNVGVNPLTQPQLDSIRTAMGAIEPSGGTPIVGATILAYRHLHEQAMAPGNRFVLLVTDGSDSCIQDNRYDVSVDPLTQLFDVAMPDAAKVNIRTFVIGAPGSEGARAFLSHMAFAGGTARSDDCDHSGSAPDAGDCHFDMTTSSDFAADFAAALNEITGRAATTCEFAVPQGDNVDPDKVNVSFFRGGTEEVQLVRDDTAACDGGADGWQYSTDDQSKIVLCGPICDEVRSDPDGRVDIVLGCETRVPR